MNMRNRLKYIINGFVDEAYNPILDTDSYKLSHFKQYPPDAHGYYGYLESRGGEYENVVFFGLQYFMKKYLTKRVTMEHIEEAQEFAALHGEPFNREGWEYIVNKHGGKFPIRIKAVSEGSVIPTHNILLSLESTDDEVFWVASFLETMIVRAVWYPTTVATISFHVKKLLENYHNMTEGNTDAVPFSLHDFGARGVSSYESSAIGGASHLVNFMGSDTVAGVRLANKYYGVSGKMAGFSIPASEHSTMTSWGRDGEEDAYRNMLNAYGEEGSIFACVSDSYDIFKATESLWGDKLREEVIKSGVTLVVRPDSGDPKTVVTKLIQILEQKFGSIVNDKGYKVLNYVKIIQGDGVNPKSIHDILEAITGLGFSASNIAFGMGGGLLQQLDRDTQKFALKCSSIQRDGIWHDVYKEPATDPGKNSKAGKLVLVKEGGQIKTIRKSEFNRETQESMLETVFEDGNILKTYTFDEVRENSNR